MVRVLISGGGIAGLTLAYWLHQYGIVPVIIEQAGGIRRDGYAIDFFGTGYDVAERMGLIDRLQSRHIPLAYVAYVNGSGKPIARLDISLMRKVMHDKYMVLMHWTLEEALYEALADDVEVRFGRSLVAVRNSPEEVTVTYDDGTQETFDLLIGADGIHSNTRRLVFGPEEQFGRYLGYHVAGYALPDRYGIGHAWKNYTEPGGTAIGYGG
jgi:2-polyprenyl-6-methoxyphenol hydroxylase-like FAD-dependent oxidoreductase